ncbi:beta-galactosidase trimerization domain-containing protein, partial [bacterium]|nr:beta-galactosidase trimerization domain-containing protein [bacterium]
SLAVTPQDEGYGLPGDCSVSAAVASFAIPGSITGLSVNGDASSRGSDELLRSAPWESLFLRMNSVWWKKTYGGVDAALTPQNTLSPAFSAVAEEAREIMGGIDILLGGSTLHTDHIGILYSPVSKFAAWTSADPETHPSAASVSQHGFDNIHMMSSSVRSFYLAFREAGYNPVFVAEDQVTDSWLIEQNIKVLVLPFIQAMSDETADYIKKFVKRGGTVIADLRPGVMDDHLVMRDTGVLDTVFDITQGTERKTPTVSGTFVSQKIRGKIPAQITFDNCRSDPTVKTGKDVFVFASVGNTPAVIFNRYGSGCGIFLNMDMGRYELMNSGRQRAAYRDVISWCLSSGGLYTPVISVRDSKGVMENGMNISVFKDFDAIYIGLLRNPALMETGDSVSGYFLDLTRIKSPGFIYNVRTREYLGTGSKIPVNVQTGKAELFAFMPYRLVGLDMKINNPVVVVGNTVDFSVTIITGRNNTKPCRHALRVEAVAPDGSLKPFLASTIEAVFGDAKSTIYISPDDPPGRWVLRVTDIVTGRQAERSFMVMATGSTNQ